MKIALRVLATLNLLLIIGTIVLYFQMGPVDSCGGCFFAFPQGLEQFAVAFLVTVLVMVVLAITAIVASARAGRSRWAVGFGVGASSPLLAVAMVLSARELLTGFMLLSLAMIGVPLAALLFTWVPAGRRADIPLLAGSPTSSQQVP